MKRALDRRDRRPPEIASTAGRTARDANESSDRFGGSRLRLPIVQRNSGRRQMGMAEAGKSVPRLVARVRPLLAGFLALLLTGVAAGAAGLCAGASCCTSSDLEVGLERPSCCDEECISPTAGATDLDRTVQTPPRPHLVLAIVPSVIPSVPNLVACWRSTDFAASPPAADSPPSTPLRL
jgi:hypothetical protein